MRSSIAVIDAALVPEDQSGFVVGTRQPIPADDVFPFAHHVLHIEPGRDPATIPNAIVIFDGRIAPWEPDQAAAAYPNGMKWVLEAEYTDADGNSVRCKMVDVPAGITPTAANIVGHYWAGDN